MNKLFFFIYFLIILSVKAQKNKTQNKYNQTNNDLNNSSNNNKNNKTISDKEFNLTESLLKYYSNSTNASNDKNQNNQKIDIEKIEQIKQKEKTEEINKIKLEKEEFDKKIEIFTLGDFTTFEIKSKSDELIYYKIDKPCIIKFAFYLSDEEKVIHINVNGPDGKSGIKEYKSFNNRNFLYHEFNATYSGQYTFFLNNHDNSDITEISFAIKNNLKVDENIGMRKLDTISEYLDDLDERINKMRLKQNIINKKTDTHNDSVNKHNKQILIYSITEVGTMVLIFIAQLFYIKNKVDKI
jgi:hypothetical protein